MLEDLLLFPLSFLFSSAIAPPSSVPSSLQLTAIKTLLFPLPPTTRRTSTQICFLQPQTARVGSCARRPDSDIRSPTDTQGPRGARHRSEKGRQKGEVPPTCCNLRPNCARSPQWITTPKNHVRPVVSADSMSTTRCFCAHGSHALAVQFTEFCSSLDQPYSLAACTYSPTNQNNDNLFHCAERVGHLAEQA